MKTPSMPYRALVHLPGRQADDPPAEVTVHKVSSRCTYLVEVEIRDTFNIVEMRREAEGDRSADGWTQLMWVSGPVKALPDVD